MHLRISTRCVVMMTNLLGPGASGVDHHHGFGPVHVHGHDHGIAHVHDLEVRRGYGFTRSKALKGALRPRRR
jgi:hypothetical protein